MDLTVIVVTWNTRELTCACLSHLERALGGRRTGRELTIEIFVVDNGSSDGTVEAVRATHPDVEVIALPTNLGFAGGNNVALERATGRLLLLLNSDVQMNGEALERCIEVLESSGDVGAVGPQLLHENGSLQNSIHAFPSAVTELFNIALLEWLLPRRFPSKRRWLGDLVEVEAVKGAALFVRREVVQEIGPLSADYFFYLEETDWCWRMRQAGWRVLHVGTARVVHVSGASSKVLDPGLARIEFHRSLYLFLRRHRSLATLGLAVGLRMTRGLVSVILLGPLALVSANQRARLAARWRLLVWHLRGCPPEIGLAQLGAARKRTEDDRREPCGDSLPGERKEIR